MSKQQIVNFAAAITCPALLLIAALGLSTICNDGAAATPPDCDPPVAIESVSETD